MRIEYLPLLRVARELQGMPRGYERFKAYLGTVLTADRTAVELPSLIAMNPMGKEHVTALLDALLAMDADGIAARVVTETAMELADELGDFGECKVGLVVADDLMGGWTNRFANEFTYRFPHLSNGDKLPRWLKNHWITGVLWSSEPASERAVREAICTAIFRTAYLRRRGPALTLREMLLQEGTVMARASCEAPVLDAEELAYTREVISPYLDATDMRTAIECLFGDEAGKTLGFSPRGLSPWAGLALALYDAKDMARS